MATHSSKGFVESSSSVRSAEHLAHAKKERRMLSERTMMGRESELTIDYAEPRPEARCNIPNARGYHRDRKHSIDKTMRISLVYDRRGNCRQSNKKIGQVEVRGRRSGFRGSRISLIRTRNFH